MTAPDFLPRAPALPPGIGAQTVLDILKTNAPSLYAQVCDFVSAHYNASMANQYRRLAPQVPFRQIDGFFNERKIKHETDLRLAKMLGMKIVTIPRRDIMLVTEEKSARGIR